MQPKLTAHHNSSTTFPISYADLKDYQARNDVFRSLAGYTISARRDVARQVALRKECSPSW